MVRCLWLQVVLLLSFVFVCYCRSKLSNLEFFSHQLDIYRLLQIVVHMSCSAFVLLVREGSALSDPYCQTTWMCICLSVRIFEVKYLRNKGR